MYIRKFALGDASPIEIGLTSTVFLTGFIGAVILPFYLFYNVITFDYFFIFILKEEDIKKI